MQKGFELRSFQYELDAEGEVRDAKSTKENHEPVTEICLNHYSNKIFIIITQFNKLGTIIEATVEINPLSISKEKFYEVNTLFGSRGSEIHEIYCRALIELFNDEDKIKEVLEGKKLLPEKGRFHNTLANKTLVLSLALKPAKDEEEERKLFKKILNSIKDQLHQII